MILPATAPLAPNGSATCLNSKRYGSRKSSCLVSCSPRTCGASDFTTYITIGAVISKIKMASPADILLARSGIRPQPPFKLNSELLLVCVRVLRRYLWRTWFARGRLTQFLLHFHNHGGRFIPLCSSTKLASSMPRVMFASNL